MSKHRKDIQGLRGIAVAVVVLFHISAPLAPGGFVGVDVFFVLSGFLISGMLIAEQRESGTVDLLSFYARRATRLLPAATAMLLVTLCVAVVLLSPAETLRIARTSVRAAVYLSNVSFARNVDYFDGLSSDEPLLHTWSLAVEEQFYIIWPVAILALGLVGALRSRRNAVVTFLAVTLISFLASLVATRAAPVSAFFLVPFRVWEFGAGALLASYVGRTSACAPNLAHVLRWAGVVLIALSSFFFSHETPFPGTAALLPVLGTLLVIASDSDRADEPLARVLRSRPLQILGELSYGWYLWHWPLLCLVALLWPAGGVVPRAFTALFALAIAFVGFWVVEAPVRRWGRTQVRPRSALVLGISLTGLAAAAGLATAHLSSRRLSLPRFAELEATRVDRSGAIATCQARFEDTQAKACEFGDSNSASLHLVVAGDSKAAQWAPALERISKSEGWHIVLMAKGSCPMESLPDFYLEALRRSYVECSQWRTNVLERIKAIDPDVVLFTASKNYVVKADAVSDTVEWSNALETSLDRLARQNPKATVLVLRDSPSFPWNVPDCLGRLAADENSGARCRVRRDMATSEAQFRGVTRALAGRQNAVALDLTQSFCDADHCYPIVRGKPGYTDADHLRASLAGSLAPELGASIASAVGIPLR